MLSGSYALRALTPEDKVIVQRSRCLRQRYAKSACRICFSACPADALSWNDQGLSWNAGLCQNCLLCVGQCPAGAFAGGEINLLGLLEDLAKVEQPVIACSMMPKQHGHAFIPCLGMLADPELLLALSLALGRRLRLNLVACQGCVNQAIMAPLQQALRTAVEHMPQLEKQVVVVSEPTELNFQERTYSRRELFGLLKNQSQRAGGCIISRMQALPQDSNFGTKALPQSRVLLLRVLKQLPDIKQQLGPRLFPERISHASCRSCTGCVGICPTGALTPPHEAGQPPRFIAEYCIACHLCEDFCRHSGIEILAAS